MAGSGTPGAVAALCAPGQKIGKGVTMKFYTALPRFIVVMLLLLSALLLLGFLVGSGIIILFGHR